MNTSTYAYQNFASKNVSSGRPLTPPVHVLRPRGAHLELLGKIPSLRLDTARVESTDGVPALCKRLPGRVLFGTHAPLLIPEAALIRTHESAQIDGPTLHALLVGNAKTFLTA